MLTICGRCFCYQTWLWKLVTSIAFSPARVLLDPGLFIQGAHPMMPNGWLPFPFAANLLEEFTQEN